MKEIDLKDIVKIQNAQMRIFEAEDVDYGYVDYGVVRANERAIQHYLDKITNNKEEQQKILDCIERHNFNCNDITFKPICDDLRKFGFSIKVGAK